MKTIKTIFAAAFLLSTIAINAQTDTLPKAGKDTTKLNIGKTEVLIIEDKKPGPEVVDSTVDIINSDTIVSISKRPARKKKPTHVWMGLELGVNTLMNADRSFSLTGADQPFSLDYGKSISVGLNLYEKTIPIVKNNFYLSTGIGLEFNNFRFESKNMILNPDTIPLTVSYYNDSAGTRQYTKNKLTTSYLNVPLLLTFATNDKKGKNAFHISVGAMVGWKYRAHQKMVYVEDGDKQKDKEFDSFNTNPFRFTAMARIGYKHIGLFANYSLNPLFQKNKGPELYPFTMGLTFIL